MNSLRNFCRLLNCYILFIPAVLTAPALSSAPLAVLAFVCSYFGHSLAATIITFFFALMGWVGMSFGAVSTAADTYGNFLYPFDSPVYLLSSFVSISAFVLLVLWLVFFSRRQKSIQNSSLSSDVEDVFAKRSSIIIGGTYLALFLMLGVAKTSLYALLSVPSPYLLLAFQILALAGFLLLLLRFIKMSKEAPCVNAFADTPAPSSVHASPSTPSPIPKAAADDAALLPPSDPPQAAPETSAAGMAVSSKSSQSNKNLLKPILISVGSTVAVVGIVVAILFSCGVFQVASSANAPASAAVQSPTLETNAAKSSPSPSNDDTAALLLSQILNIDLNNAQKRVSNIDLNPEYIVEFCLSVLENDSFQKSMQTYIDEGLSRNASLSMHFACFYQCYSLTELSSEQQKQIKTRLVSIPESEILDAINAIRTVDLSADYFDSGSSKADAMYRIHRIMAVIDQIYGISYMGYNDFLNFYNSSDRDDFQNSNLYKKRIDFAKKIVDIICFEK